MKLKMLLPCISVLLLYGFIQGTAESVSCIHSHGYLAFGMIRLCCLTILEHLNAWTFKAVLWSGALIVILVFLYISKLLLKKTCEIIFPRVRMIRIDVPDYQKLAEHLIGFAVFSCVALLLLWKTNHTLLPGFWHPKSLFGNAVLVSFLGLLGYLLFWRHWVPRIHFSPGKFLNRAAVCALLLLAVFNTAMYVDENHNTPRSPNIILVLVDTLRADRLGCYGFPEGTSPNIDAFSADSIQFEQAIAAAPWTSPSIASIITSQSAATLGIMLAWHSSLMNLANRFVTMAEICKENNYLTKGIISNALIARKTGFGQGFDSYDEENALGHDHISSPSVTRKAIAFVEANRDRKFFLFLHYFDPHCNYIPHGGYNRVPDYAGPLNSEIPITDLLDMAPYMSQHDIDYLRNNYESEIHYTDRHIGMFLDRLRKLDLYDNALIIFTSDHGEEFFDRGNYYIGHTETLYQELIHVPLLIKLPGASEKTIVPQAVDLIDLLPSVMDFCKLKLPEGDQFAGEVFDLQRPRLYPEEKPIFSDTCHPVLRMRSVIRQGWKLIDYPNMRLKKLYDLKRDPLEKENLYGSCEQVSDQLEALLQQWKAPTNMPVDTPPRDEMGFSDKEKARLKALGYMK